ncbi:MAG: vWA domain-containing protein, partial [Planctomycetota bacterium]
RDIVVFVDGSGSMEGERWARMRTALRQLLPCIPSTDALSLRFFTRAMGREQFRLPAVDAASERADAREEALRWLSRMHVPGGATDILTSLRELSRSREERPHADDGDDPDGLIILVSDGETRSNAQRRKAAVRRLRDGRDELVAIHVGDGRGATFLKGLLAKGADVIRAGELEGLLDVLQESIHDLDLVEGGHLVALGSEVEDVGTPRDVGLLDQALRASQELLEQREPLACERAIPSRATEDAVPFVGLTSEALTLAGRSTVFAAAGERGRGFTVGLAAPLVGDGVGPDTGASGGTSGGATSTGWAAEVRSEPGWLGPLFRAAARTRDLADQELLGADAVPEPEVSWVDDPRALFGAATVRRGSFLVIDGLASDAPESLRATIRRSGGIANDGARAAGEVLAEVDALWLPTARLPGGVRTIGEPLALRAIEKGEALTVTLTSSDPSRPWGSGALSFEARGPVELRAAGVPAVAPALRSAQEAGRPDRFLLGLAGSNRETSQGGEAGGRRGHPAVRWLLFLGLGAVFAGSWRALRAV